MATTYFPDSAGINTNLLPINPIADQALLDIVFDDPYYGLGNAANYPRWAVLQSSNVNATANNEKLTFQAELRTYFGLEPA